MPADTNSARAYQVCRTGAISSSHCIADAWSRNTRKGRSLRVLRSNSSIISAATSPLITKATGPRRAFSVTDMAMLPSGLWQVRRARAVRTSNRPVFDKATRFAQPWRVYALDLTGQKHASDLRGNELVVVRYRPFKRHRTPRLRRFDGRTVFPRPHPTLGVRWAVGARKTRPSWAIGAWWADMGIHLRLSGGGRKLAREEPTEATEMEYTRANAFAAFEIALHRLEVRQRELGAWEEGNLLDALVAISSGEYAVAVGFIAAAGRAPTPAEISPVARRGTLSRADIRVRFHDLRAAEK